MAKKKKGIASDSIVERKKELPVTDIGGEKVMFQLSQGKYYGLDSVGSRVWDLMENPLSVQHIIESLMQEYDVDSLTCQEQVIEFIQKLYTEDLVCVLDADVG